MNPIILPVAELKPALTGLGKILCKRSTLPVLSHVRVERTPTGHLDLGVTDLDVSAVVRLDTPASDEPIALLVPFEDLQHLAKGCGRAESLLLVPEKNRVVIKFPCGGQVIEHRCESLPVEEFPAIPELKGSPALLPAAVRQSIHEALQCASSDATRLILNGAYLDVSNPAGHYVVGTDGRHLFSSNSFTLPLTASVILPSHRFLGWKEFSTDGDWNLRVSAPVKDKPVELELATDHWRFFSRSIEGNYPNWRQVVPGNFQSSIDLDPDGVDALVQTIARMPNYDVINFAIGLELKGERLTLLAKSSRDDPWIRVEVKGARVTGREMTTHVNRELVTKALRFGLARIELIDPLSPLRFSSGGKQMIVMPTRPEPSHAPSNPTSAAPAPEEPAVPEPAGVAQPEGQQKPVPEPEPQAALNSAAPAASAPVVVNAEPPLETALTQLELVRGHFRQAVAGLQQLAAALKVASREPQASSQKP